MKTSFCAPVFALAAAFIAAPESARIYPEPYLYITAGDSMCGMKYWTDIPYDFFDVWVWLSPGDSGATGAEFRLDIPTGRGPRRASGALEPPQSVQPRDGGQVLPSEAEKVLIEVYDISGRRVARLLEGRELPAGGHEVSWDGRDQDGHDQVILSGGPCS